MDFVATIPSSPTRGERRTILFVVRHVGISSPDDTAPVTVTAVDDDSPVEEEEEDFLSFCH